MYRQNEMVSVANSFRRLLKDKLSSIDHMTRTMITEMQLAGCSKAMIAEYLPEYFNEVAREVLEEQNRRNAG